MSTNFEAKGGRIVLAAFREVRKCHPDAPLIIVGDRPSDIVAGSRSNLRRVPAKGDSRRVSTFPANSGGARALVNATRCDICPVLFIEAGYVGCPVISTRKFAIPEIIDDGRTGLLLDDSSQPSALAGAMEWMLEHEYEYQQMREVAWEKARGLHSKAQFEERLGACICESVADERMPAWCIRS